MNVQEMDLMNVLKDSNYTNQRQLASETGYSLGKVNASIKTLMEEGFLDKGLNLTKQAERVFDANRPKQAVILAAGVGMRMVPINVQVSKGLLEVHGEPLIERIIRQLHEVKITDIKVVVGFMKEQYEYLIDKWDVELIYNKHYADRNNLYSLAKAAEALDNAYIIPCDIWCKQNPFNENELYSWYMVGDREDEDSTVRINRKRELKIVDEDENGNRMIGISYVCGKEAEYLKKRMGEMLESRKYDHSFWEEAAVQNHKMIFYPKVVSSENVYEVNTLEELRDLDDNSNQLNSELLDIIANTLHCDLKEIVEIEALKKGMTNRSFRFRCRDLRPGLLHESEKWLQNYRISGKHQSL